MIDFFCSSVTAGLYCASFWSLTHETTSLISPSVTQAPWIRSSLGFEAVTTNISPKPISFSAPDWSSMTLESVVEATEKASLDGIFAFMTPVITSTEGLCVATTKWIPIALAIWAKRTIADSTSLPATIIRSFNSSINRTI